MGFLWGYQRTFHLILLLAVLMLYTALYTTNYIFWQKFQFEMYSLYWFPLLALVFILLLVLRGLSCCGCCFPWFHYTTLILELFVQIFTFIFEIYVLIVDADQTINQKGPKPMYDAVCFVLTIIAIAVYFLLVYKLLPVLTTLCCGGQSDKEELDKEVKGESSTEHQPVAP